MSYCDTCIHHEVCGLEGVDDEGMTYCADRIEPRDDVISKKAVFNLMRGLTRWCVISEDGKFNNVVLLYDDVMSSIDKLSSVTPQQKTGYWISGHEETGALGITYTEKICSNCGWHHSLVIPKNYCPNCGIKMVEPQDDTDSNVVSNQTPILASPSLTELKKLNCTSFAKLLRIESEDVDTRADNLSYDCMNKIAELIDCMNKIVELINCMSKIAESINCIIEIAGLVEPQEREEPETAHWITKDSKEQGYDIGGVKTWYVQIMCSKCGFIKTAIEGHTRQYHYCPNCGRKMV